MRHTFAVLLAIGAALSGPVVTSAQAPDLSGNWIRGGRVVFGPWDFTEAGKRKFDSYDFKKDDPAYGCIGWETSSPSRPRMSIPPESGDAGESWRRRELGEER
jgi:hypothetical protein